MIIMMACKPGYKNSKERQALNVGNKLQQGVEVTLVGDLCGKEVMILWPKITSPFAFPK